VHVFVTSDTITGIWTYTRELVTGLVSQGARVTLVSFGQIPLPHQTTWMDSLHGLDYRPTAFRLEWMQEGQEDLGDSASYLEGLVRELKPDVLHLGQFCYGNLPVKIPRVVVAHGDMITWWMSVHGREPRETKWLRWYRDTVNRGILGADAVVAPSAWMLEALKRSFSHPVRDCVIYNGRNPIFFNPYVNKEDSVMTVGRLWDAGKQVFLLTQHEHPVPVCIVGSDPLVHVPRIPIRADVKLAKDQASVAIRGPQTEAQLRMLYSRSAIYAATARYEPFGMPALEAALSRCAIVANDIPSMREIWGDAAAYFRANDAGSLAEVIKKLGGDRELCRSYGSLAYKRARERFTGKRMTDEYLDLYRGLLAQQVAAA
jgi:glycogen synthase